MNKTPRESVHRSKRLQTARTLDTRRIYLDHASTAPLQPQVRDLMRDSAELGEAGNPSSVHADGRRARQLIDQARENIAAWLGCDFAEVIFTSSGTEAANLAILGAALANDDPSRKRVIMSSGEHHCVLNTRGLLEALGYVVDLAPIDEFSFVNLSALERMMGDDLLLVSLMHANNETGAIQPVTAASALAHRFGAWFHTDAVQTFLAWPWSVGDLDADLVSVSAHKVGGPAGVGALYIRAGVKIRPLHVGGGQEREMRAGTENTVGIAGFGAVSPSNGLRRLARDAFLAELVGGEIPFVPTLDPEYHAMLGGHVHGRFPGLSAESMLIVLDRLGVSASAGAACAAGSIEPSHVMLAAGYDETEAREGLRFTFGDDTTVEDAREAAHRVLAAAEQVSQGRARVA